MTITSNKGLFYSPYFCFNQKQIFCRGKYIRGYADERFEVLCRKQTSPYLVQMASRAFALAHS